MKHKVTEGLKGALKMSWRPLILPIALLLCLLWALVTLIPSLLIAPVYGYYDAYHRAEGLVMGEESKAKKRERKLWAIFKAFEAPITKLLDI